MAESGHHMTGPVDQDPPKVVDLSPVFAVLDRLPNPERTQNAMQVAAQFLEYAAYEMALEQNAGDVSEIIHMAARLDQAARRIDDKAISRNASRDHREI
ncbi:MAG: hypothetical protein R8G34_02225 [Paracoccaceae bacterium]|nr:hypothetical protein [Paracoccaceae bacterium]